jgi:TolB-like protein
MLRRLFAVLAGLLVPLCALPSSAATPTLVVYPFAVNGAMPDGLGNQLSDKIAAEIKALGGVNVIRGAASTKPADYRAAAQAAGADVYFSGSIVPIFNQFSAIENLVSTHSGTVVWSVSIQFRSIADVIGQGARVRDELYHGAPAPPAGIAANGASLITSPPMSGYAVLPVTGSASSADRTYALNAIVDALKSRGHNVAPVTSANAIDPITGGALVCTTSGAQTLVVGSLDTTRVATSGTTPQTTAHIDLRTFDCRSHELDLKPTVVNHIAPVADDAIRGAVDDAISAFPAPS